MLFDTLKISEDLKTSFTEEQAKALARVLNDATEGQVLTKADLAPLERDIAAMRAEQSQLAERYKSQLTTEIGTVAKLTSDVESRLKSQISDLKVDVTQQVSLLRADTIKWVFAAISFNLFGTAALITGLIKFFGK